MSGLLGAAAAVIIYKTLHDKNKPTKNDKKTKR